MLLNRVKAVLEDIPVPLQVTIIVKKELPADELPQPFSRFRLVGFNQHHEQGYPLPPELGELLLRRVQLAQGVAQLVVEVDLLPLEVKEVELHQQLPGPLKLL